jgi:hypothetical protein
VGVAERPEFLHQCDQLVETWSRAGKRTQLMVDPGKHHFDVIDRLKDHHSDMTRILLGLVPCSKWQGSQFCGLVN